MQFSFATEFFKDMINRIEYGALHNKANEREYKQSRSSGVEW